jgi:hypothetical protein
MDRTEPATERSAVTLCGEATGLDTRVRVFDVMNGRLALAGE